MKAFLCLVNAHNALISGRIILDILFGRRQPNAEYQMTICVDDKNVAIALLKHLSSVEGYDYMTWDGETVVDMSSAIFQEDHGEEEGPVDRGIFDREEEVPLSSMKSILSLQKAVGRSTVWIDIYSFVVDPSLPGTVLENRLKVRFSTPVSFNDFRKGNTFRVRG